MNHTLPSMRAWLLMLCLLCTAAVANAWTVSITKTNVKCNGAANGTATANVSGSAFIVAFANYSWSNGATTKTITGLAPGTYSVTVTSLGSSKIATTAITQPTAINASVVAVSPCQGLCNGYAYASITGGTPPYLRQWSNGATTAFVSGLCAGTYWLTITDGNGCKKIVGTSLTPLSVNVTATQATCNATGSATAVASGTPPFTYLWSTGATTTTISGLASGTYSVTASGINGCTASASVTVTAAPVPTVNLSVTPVQCNNPCSGAITTVVTSASSFAVQWSDGATTLSRTALCAGTYSITVYDGNGCTAGATANVTQAGLSATVTTTNATGCGGNGAASVTTTGTGTGPFTFHWSTGAQTPSLSNLSPGTYSVTVTNLSTGCVATASGTVGGSTGISVTSVHSNVTCAGACNGTAATAVTGGTAPFTYNWSNGATTATLNNLCPGSYAVTVHDALGCSATNAFVITTPTAMAISATATNLLCNGSTTGSASVVVVGGTAPYSFSWSNGGTGATISNLGAGVYCVTVTDANGCGVSNCVVISGNSNPFQPSDSYVAPGCDDDCEGFIQLVFMGGTGPYSYQWSNGSTAGVLLDVCEGIYTVTASDAIGCTLSETFEVINYDCGGPEITLTATNPSCGNCNGSIVATVSSGAQYTSYQWSTGDSTFTNMVDNLCPGTYTVTVYDSNGDSGQRSVTLVNAGLQPTAFAVAPCPNQCNGIVAATIIGTSPSYYFEWSNGATSSFQSNLCPGTYVVTVTSFEGCTGTVTAVVNSGITVATVGDSVCAGSCDGDVYASASGGNAPYTYVWSDNGAGGPERHNLCALGSLTVTVTDDQGCTAQGVTPIVSETFPQNFYTVPSSCGACNGTAVGGSPGSGSFLWSTGETTSSVANLCPGYYNVSATGNNGCSSVVNFQIQDVSPITIAVSSTVSSPTCNGTITVTASGGVAPYFFTVGTDTFDQTLTGLCPGPYFVVATDANGCTAWSTFAIGITGTFYATAVATNTCIGSCVGIIYGTPYGGLPPYTFEWSNGATTQNVTGACPGNHIVTVTDADGATTSAFTIVEAQQDPNIIFTTTTATCNNCDGAISTIVQGGAVAYVWNTGAVTTSISDLCAGSYTLTVTNAIGCTSAKTTTVGDNCRTGSEQAGFENATLYPNPTTGNATLKFNSASGETVVLRMLDVTGKLLQTHNVNVSKGLNTIDIDISGYANGVYMLQRVGEGGTQTLKLTKQ